MLVLLLQFLTEITSLAYLDVQSEGSEPRTDFAVYPFLTFYLRREVQKSEHNIIISHYRLGSKWPIPALLKRITPAMSVGPWPHGDAGAAPREDVEGISLDHGGHQQR